MSLEALMLILRGVAAVVPGEATMVLLITLVQEVIFGGVSFGRSTTPVLLVSGLLTFLSALSGGMVAGWIAKGFPMVAAFIMAAEVPAETTWLVASGKTSGPLWFDIIAAGSLVVGILLGARAAVRLRRAPDSAPAEG